MSLGMLWQRVALLTHEIRMMGVRSLSFLLALAFVIVPL